MFRSIVVPLDRSRLSSQALPVAQAVLARGGTIQFLHVVPAGDDYLPEVAEDDFGWGVDELLARAGTVRCDLDRQIVEWQGDGTLVARASLAVEIGDPAERIVDVADGRQSDLVAMTSRGFGGIKRAWFGSVTDRVVRHSRVPVLVARPTDGVRLEPAAGIRSLVVPLDGSLLAEQALLPARALARQLGVPIILVRAYQLTPMIPPIDGAVLAMPELATATKDAAEEYLAGVRQQLEADGLAASFAADRGSPFEVIDAHTEPTDLVVLTSHGRGGIGRWLLGGVADKLIRECRAPVLVIPARRAGEGPDTGR